MSFNQLWAHFNCFLISADGLLKTTVLGIQNSQLQMSLAERGIKSYSFFEKCFNLINRRSVAWFLCALQKRHRIVIISQPIFGLTFHKPRYSLLNARQWSWRS